MLVLLTTALASGGLFSFITYLITRRDTAKSKLDHREKVINDHDARLKELEIQVTRIELLLCLNCYPEDTYTVISVAKRYFALGGNAYAERLLKEWAEKYGIDASKYMGTKL